MPIWLRYLAENGYYGTGDVGAMVAKRVQSLRNPSGRSFEDHTPDGRWYRILRSRVAGGGTVTVMTDITELKQAEQDLADKEAPNSILCSTTCRARSSTRTTI